MECSKKIDDKVFMSSIDHVSIGHTFPSHTPSLKWLYIMTAISKNRACSNIAWADSPEELKVWWDMLGHPAPIVSEND